MDVCQKQKQALASHRMWSLERSDHLIRVIHTNMYVCTYDFVPFILIQFCKQNIKFKYIHTYIQIYIIYKYNIGKHTFVVSQFSVWLIIAPWQWQRKIVFIYCIYIFIPTGETYFSVFVIFSNINFIVHLRSNTSQKLISSFVEKIFFTPLLLCIRFFLLEYI